MRIGVCDDQKENREVIIDKVKKSYPVRVSGHINADDRMKRNLSKKSVSENSRILGNALSRIVSHGAHPIDTASSIGVLSASE